MDSIAEPLQDGVSVVVPVYNGEETLEALVERLGAVLQPLGLPHEIILVDDGSSDRSWRCIERLAASRPTVRGVNLMRNYGQHNALLCGIRRARYAVTATLDDDLQNPPEELPRLLEALDADHDLVYGTPERASHPKGHVLASTLLKFALSVALGARHARIIAPFRVFRTRLRGAFDLADTPSVIVDIYLGWGTTRIRSVPVRHDAREQGRTNYTFRRRVRTAFDLLTGYSTVPLKTASWIGFALTVFGVGVLVYVLVGRLLYGGTASGFAFLGSAIAIFSGAQLFALGIFGEYLARVFQRTMGRPPYAVADSTDGSDEAAALSGTRRTSASRE